MIALWIIGIIVLLFVFLLTLKFTVTIVYHDELAVYVRVLFIKIPILPKKEQKRGPHSMSEKKAQRLREKLEKKRLKKEEAKKKKASKKGSAEEKKKKTLPEILDMITMVRTIAVKVITKFWKHLRIDIARLRIRVATGDAAETAIAYGAVTGAINTLFPILEQAKNFDLPSQKNIDVVADFVSEELEADVKISFSLRLWHVLDVAFAALFSFIGHQFKKAAKADTNPPHTDIPRNSSSR